jgi:hypothetical protein
MKSIKNFLKKGGRGDEEWKYNRGVKVVQSTLYTNMEFSQ